MKNKAEVVTRTGKTQRFLGAQSYRIEYHWSGFVSVFTEGFGPTVDSKPTGVFFRPQSACISVASLDEEELAADTVRLHEIDQKLSRK
jgi:hypothetical protein